MAKQCPPGGEGLSHSPADGGDYPWEVTLLPSVVNSWQTGSVLSPGLRPAVRRPVLRTAISPLGLGRHGSAPGGRRHVAERTEDAGPRLLCAPWRICLGDRPGDLGPHGRNRRPHRSELSISNWPDKLLGTHPVNWFLSRASRVRLARLPNSGGISPLNSFSLRYNSVRLARPPSSGGISPLNWL